MSEVNWTAVAVIVALLANILVVAVMAGKLLQHGSDIQRQLHVIQEILQPLPERIGRAEQRSKENNVRIARLEETHMKG